MTCMMQMKDDITEHRYGYAASKRKRRSVMVGTLHAWWSCCGWYITCMMILLWLIHYMHDDLVMVDTLHAWWSCCGWYITCMMILLSSILSWPSPSFNACILMMVSWSLASSSLALLTSNSNSALTTSALDKASSETTHYHTHNCTKIFR